MSPSSTWFIGALLRTKRSHYRKLTQEELERHEKESKLSEVDGRAVQAEEELSSLRLKVKDMQEEMQQNERSLKAEVSSPGRSSRC